MARMASAGFDQKQESGTLLGSSTWVAGAHTVVGCFPSARVEVELLRRELVAIDDVGMAGSGFTHYATTLAQKKQS